VRLSGLVAATAAALAIIASSAFGFAWTVEGTGAIETGESEAVSLKLKKESMTKLSGTVSGLEVELTSTGLEGVETKLEANGVLSGKMKFTGLKLAKPVGCGPPASITTLPLKGELVKIGSTLYDKIVPSGGTGPLATVTLTGECALAGVPFKLTGNLFAQVEPVETRLLEQPFEFSPTIEAAAGGIFEIGGNAGKLTMTARLELAPLPFKFWPVVTPPKYQMNAYGPSLEGFPFNNQVFTVGGNTIVCKNGAFSSGIAFPEATLSIIPTYAECAAFGLPNAVSFTPATCVLKSLKAVKNGANYESQAGIDCTGNPMKFQVLGGLGNLCEVTLGTQTKKPKFVLVNRPGPPRFVEFQANITGLTYDVVANQPVCPLATGRYLNGSYTGNFSLFALGGKEFFIG
jgi:hypothetical protein